MRPYVKLACALIVLVIVLHIYTQLYGTVAQKSLQYANLQNRIGVETQTTMSPVASQAVLAEIASDETSIGKYFVPKTELVSFVDNLETLGSQEGTPITVSSSRVVSGPIPGASLTLVIQGTFDQVMRSVGVVEYLPYDITTSGLTLTENPDGTWVANLSITVGSAATSS